MGRGFSAHAALTGEMETGVVKPRPGRGRNKDLITARNDALMHRYYYYSRLHKKKYDDILILLSMDFYLNPVSIGRYLIQLAEQSKVIFSKAPGVKKLANTFPQFKWEQPAPEQNKRQTIFVN